FRQFTTQFNYRDRQFRLGAAGDPADVAEPGTSVRFSIEGGGRGAITSTMAVTYPATRVPVTVDIEGTSHAMVLDTGASEVTVRSSVFDALTADGRAVLADLPISTAAGQTTAKVTRVRSVTAGGETVAAVPVLTIGDASMSTDE